MVGTILYSFRRHDDYIDGSNIDIFHRQSKRQNYMNQTTENQPKNALMTTESNHISACRSHIERNYPMLIYHFLPFLEVDWLDPDVEPDFPVATPSGGMAGAPGIGGSFTGLNVASLENLTYPLR